MLVNENEKVDTTAFQAAMTTQLMVTPSISYQLNIVSIFLDVHPATTFNNYTYVFFIEPL